MKKQLYSNHQGGVKAPLNGLANLALFASSYFVLADFRLKLVTDMFSKHKDIKPKKSAIDLVY